MMNDINTITHEDFRGLSEMDASQKMIGYLIMMIAKNGLRKTEIYTKELFVLKNDHSKQEAAKHVDYNQNVDTEKEIAELQLLSSDIMDWLIREGLIGTTNQQTLSSGHSSYAGVNLTAKGMVISQQTNAELLNNESVSSLIEKGNVPDDYYGKIGNFVGGVIAGLSNGMT